MKQKFGDQKLFPSRIPLWCLISAAACIYTYVYADRVTRLSHMHAWIPIHI